MGATWRDEVKKSSEEIYIEAVDDANGILLTNSKNFLINSQNIFDLNLYSFITPIKYFKTLL